MKNRRRLGTATRGFARLALALLSAAVLSGCSSGNEKDAKAKENIKAEREKLDADDRKLVDEQDKCPIMPDNRLGVMGPPIKLKLKDQTVFVCCKGCVKKAERTPDETLAKVAELKAKNKSGAK